MKHTCSNLYIIVTLGFLYACGGSGYDDSPNDTQTPNTLSLTVKLDGSQQVPQPVQTAAIGTAELVLDQETGALSGRLTVSNPSSTITAAHIHQAIAGYNSIPFLPLQKSETDNNVWNIPPDTVLSSNEVESLLMGGMYINAHSANHPAGEIRGQIVGGGAEVIQVKLAGANEVPSIDSSGDGVAFVTLNKATAHLNVIVHINNLIATNAHIHQGFAGANGSAVVTLNENVDDNFIWEATATLPEEHLDALLNGEMYVNVHTAANPGGEIRGQILMPSFSFIQKTVFNAKCISCHSGAGALGGLRLDDGNTYSRLVFSASKQNLALDLVAPGDPDNSYLIHKLEGTASTGLQMPPSGDPLEEIVIDNIRQWIAQGAEHN